MNLKFRWMFCVFVLFTLSIPVQAQFIKCDAELRRRSNGQRQLSCARPYLHRCGCRRELCA